MAARPHEPTEASRAKVQALAMVVTHVNDIATALGMSTATLYKYYREELTHGRARALQKVNTTIYQRALDGDAKLLIYLSEKLSHLLDEDRAILQGDQVGFDASRLSTATLEEIMDARERGDLGPATIEHQPIEDD